MNLESAVPANSKIGRKRLFGIGIIILSLFVVLSFAADGRIEFMWRWIVELKDPGFERCKQEKSLPLYDSYQFAICDVGVQSGDKFSAYIFDSSGQILQNNEKRDARWMSSIRTYVYKSLNNDSRYENYFVITNNGYHPQLLRNGIYYVRFSKLDRQGYENMIVVD
jgi:hypothetical protein